MKEKRIVPSWALVYISIIFVYTLFASVSCTCTAEFKCPEKRPQTDDIEIAETDEPHITFIVLGDQGTGDDRQKRVACGMAIVMNNPKYGADFVIGTGDNFYRDNIHPDGVNSVTDVVWKNKFEDVYKDIYGSEGFDKFYMTLGNHDYKGKADEQVLYTTENKVDSSWYMPAKYYRFDKKIGESGDSVSFFALDTTPFIYKSYLKEKKFQEQVQAQLDWLQNSLNNSNARWKIVYGHHPPRSNGEHGDALCQVEGSDKTKWVKLLKIIEGGGVKAGFFGHDHHLEASKPVNGVHYFVSGGGSQNPKRRDVKPLEIPYIAIQNNGFIWVRVTKSEMTVVIFDKDGNPKWNTTITQPDTEDSETVNWSQLIGNPDTLNDFCNK